MTQPVRRVLVIASVVLMSAALGLPALHAQEALQVRIRQTDLKPDGETQLVVSVAGPQVNRLLSANEFTVTEEDQQVSIRDVRPLSETAAQTVSVVLLIDISGSTAGAPIEAAKQAAKSFIGHVLPKGIRVAIVAFEQAATVRSDFSTDPQALIQTVDSLQPKGETALYDGLLLGVSLLEKQEGLRNLVLFSDGKDTVSKGTLDQAVAAAKAAQTPVLAVGLVTPDTDQPSLDRIAQESGGRSLSAADSGQLSQAFGQAASDIASQYVISYTSSRVAPQELDLAVTVNVDGATATDASVVLNPRIEPPAPVESAAIGGGVLSSELGLYLGMIAFFVAALLVFSLAVSRTSGGQAARVLRRGLGAYDRAGGRVRETDSVASSISKRAVDIVGQFPKPKGLEERLQLQLDRAGWPIRANEFLAIQGGSAVAILLLGVAISNSWLVAILLAVLGVFLPRLVLSQRVQRRQAAFLSQLPDTLQLLSASLQAGYGLLQAIDTVTKESSPPTSSEFARALSEARLGMPLEEALDHMAERMGSDDFRWVVMAINIQREVGGNLASLLTTVADTLREREQLRRQVRVLSAEGRLSAWILTLLPFGLIAYLALVNRPYLALLFERSIGRIMMVLALFFIGVGVLWMRRMIRIEV